MLNVLFKKPWLASLEEGPEAAGPTLIQNEASVVSPGTELAILSGGEGWAPLPYVPGYGSVGRVLQAGPDCARRGIQEGDRVFTYGKHAERVASDCVLVPVPEGLAPERAVLARMAAVSITSTRVSDIEFGDDVLVVGAGLVGLFAAQLARLSGASVSVVDVAERRRAVAAACGAERCFSPGPGLYDELRAATGGELFHAVIEATGNPAAAEEAIRYVGRQGELILLGSPRGPRQADLTPLLNRIHLCPDVVTVKGAHEWRFPTLRDDFVKHSLERNVELILRAIASGRLLAEPLLTHVVPPSACVSVYAGLKDAKDSYLGVVYDWRKR